MTAFSPGFIKPADVADNGNDEFTKVLMHFDGDFADVNAGGSAKTWTLQSGSTYFDFGAAKFGSNGANFKNTGAHTFGRVVTPHSTDFEFGSSDFTIDFWFRYDVVRLSCYLCGYKSSTVLGWNISVGGGGSAGSAPNAAFTLKANFYKASGGAFLAQASVTSSFTGWHHAAIVRNGNSLTVYIDGVAGTPVTMDEAVRSASDSVLALGAFGDTDSAAGLDGGMDEFRLSKGIARWTANFTPPASPYS